MLGRKFNNIDEARECAMASIDRNFSELVTRNMCSSSFERDYLLGMCSGFDVIALFDFRVFDIVFEAMLAVNECARKEKLLRTENENG